MKQRDGNLFKAHGVDGRNRQFQTEGQAPLAQSAERFHGKEKVDGSIPSGGSGPAGACPRGWLRIEPLAG